jgi:hypothetical protein
MHWNEWNTAGDLERDEIRESSTAEEGDEIYESIAKT